MGYRNIDYGLPINSLNGICGDGPIYKVCNYINGTLTRRHSINIPQHRQERTKDQKVSDH